MEPSARGLCEKGAQQEGVGAYVMAHLRYSTCCSTIRSNVDGCGGSGGCGLGGRGLSTKHVTHTPTTDQNFEVLTYF